MRIGYGYNRTRAAVQSAGVDRLYLDTDQTRRAERGHMFRDLREGDTLVMLAISDLGAGKGLRNMRADLEGRGVAIEVAQAAEPEQQKPVGRPRAWVMSGEDEDRLRGLWENVASDGGYILDLACDLMGEDKADKKAREKTRQRLLRRFGPRR